MWKKCYHLSITYTNGITIFYDNIQYKKGLKYFRFRKYYDKDLHSEISLENIEKIRCGDNGKEI